MDDSDDDDDAEPPEEAPPPEEECPPPPMDSGIRRRRDLGSRASTRDRWAWPVRDEEEHDRLRDEYVASFEEPPSEVVAEWLDNRRRR